MTEQMTPPQSYDWDNPTDAEIAADRWHRHYSRGRHGIREWPRDEPYRKRETERAQSALDAVSEANIITTDEELDALPNGSAILSDNHVVYEATQDSLGERAWAWGQKRRASKFVVLPARVLFRPEVTP